MAFLTIQPFSCILYKVLFQLVFSHLNRESEVSQ